MFRAGLVAAPGRVNWSDGDPQTVWNSGTWAPQWYFLTLDGPQLVERIELLVAQTPAGKARNNLQQLVHLIRLTARYIATATASRPKGSRRARVAPNIASDGAPNNARSGILLTR